MSRLLVTALIWGVFGAYLYVNLCELVPVWLGGDWRPPKGWDSTIGFAVSFYLLSLLHSAWALGASRAGVFFLVSAVVGWGFEEVGVRTGWVYGSYHYSDMLGPKLGSVPVLIPLAWFMMIYPCYVLSGLLAGGSPFGPGERGGSRILGGWGRGGMWGSVLLGAVLMTGWDLVMDPGMTAAGYWVWHSPGRINWYGVPLHNFAGWMATTVTVYGVWRAIEVRWGIRPMGWPGQAGNRGGVGVDAWTGAVPLMAYGVLFVRYLFDTHDNSGVFARVACVTMGLPLVVGGALYVRWCWRQRVVRVEPTAGVGAEGRAEASRAA